MKSLLSALLFAIPAAAQTSGDRISSRKIITMKPTGETVQLLTSGKETNGAYAEFLVTLPEGKPGPPLHTHPKQHEYFEAVEGTLGLYADGKKLILQPGESFTVEPGVQHAFFNAGTGTAKWKARVTPALNFEYLAEETILALNRAFPEMPSDYELKYILWQAKGEYYLADVSMFKQKILWPLKGWWGKITGRAKAVTPRKHAYHLPNKIP
ncbi:cupin domain-containing protein [Chitinophaga caseinilytica]|uniref:Cupin domain-containing protein n=1 Tax=Chitinophaga caseinilytica TaxID=2267521 RepID=A0ABZ2Z419_9BACT